MAVNKRESLLKRVYNFYSRDLSSSEFEKVFLRETPARYRYLVRSMGKDGEKSGRFGFIRFIKNLALTFLSKLSPVIRIIYTAVIIYFFIGMIQGIWEMALLAFVVVNLIFMFEVADKLTIRDELQVAKDVQASLIPAKLPDNRFFEISNYYETANEVGGDFFDSICKGNSNVYMVGDVSGKGMSAALYMVQARLLIANNVEEKDDFKTAISGVNESLIKFLKKGFFFTSVFAVTKDNAIRFFRAGHNPVLYYSSAKRECREVKQSGLGIGLISGDKFHDSIEAAEMTASPNDIFILYSDGLTETMNPSSEEFGVERLKGLIVKYSHESADRIRDVIVEELKKFRSYAEVHDDITFMIFKAGEVKEPDQVRVL